jgi:biotin synthase
MNNQHLNELQDAAQAGRAISESAAMAILRARHGDMAPVFAAATALRRRRFGDKIHLCSIMNAKCGACREDCAFCAQSVHHHAAIDAYALRPEKEMARAYQEASALPIDHFGVVTSGGALNSEGVDQVCRVMESHKTGHVTWCASLGTLKKDALLQLKQSGMKRFHHNLETAESFFPKICSTHTYAQRLATVRAVKDAGLEICCGGILGMGESMEQRVEFAAALAHEKVDSIPLNFLAPMPGTPLEGRPIMEPAEILRTIAMFRMMNPAAEIKVCAGRMHLRDLQSMIFLAGASGMMIGDLLTVAGRNVKQDLQMLKDLEVEYAR